MRALVVAGFIAFTAALAGAQTSKLGLFTDSMDIGAPPLKGGVEYNDATKEYRITGTGADIWARADQFHYAWKEMSGNFIVTATTKILTDGNAHRKASIMLRKGTATDDAFVHLAIHGDGMPSIQFRSVKNDTVNTLDFPIEGPGVFTLKLQRQGNAVRFYVGKDGAALRDLGSTQAALGNPVLVGLAVASHSVDALTTVQFTNVSIEQPAAPAQKK